MQHPLALIHPNCRCRASPPPCVTLLSVLSKDHTNYNGAFVIRHMGDFITKKNIYICSVNHYFETNVFALNTRISHKKKFHCLPHVPYMETSLTKNKMAMTHENIEQWTKEMSSFIITHCVIMVLMYCNSDTDFQRKTDSLVAYGLT